ncbi:hypothetical protein ASD79_09960 [Caulobacter sp. Root655]|uniref:hypothetical protein n=1 Tax=Caulobacter sp. Root655 TaxID=1736578 RepID=UPI0006FDAAD9|nr:hypothetical protein [Caulobacter sp. Root655]KRA59853.1 hypothetical protein ASD79_09960 [Caulobacter sp. Root655]
MSDERPNPAPPNLESLTIWSVLVGTAVVAVAVVTITATPGRIAAMRTNGGYVLVDNRTRNSVVIHATTDDGRLCGTVKVAAGNRGRAPVCGRETDLFVVGRGVPTPDSHVVAAQNGVYQVRWRNGLSIEQHEPY